MVEIALWQEKIKKDFLRVLDYIFMQKFAYIKKKQYFCSQNNGNRFRESPYFERIYL